MIKQNLQRITAVTFWILIAGFLLYYLNLRDFDYMLVGNEVVEWLQSPWGPFLFVVLYCLRPFIFFSATVLSVASAIVYGFWGGLVITTIAANLSVIVAYLLGRFVFSSDVILNLQVAGNIVTSMRNNAFSGTLIARLLFAPFDAVSYIAGALKLPYVPFALATILGSIPGSIAIVSFGAGVEDVTKLDEFELQPGYLILSGVLIALSIGVKVIIERRKFTAKNAKNAKGKM